MRTLPGTTVAEASQRSPRMILTAALMCVRRKKTARVQEKRPKHNMASSWINLANIGVPAI